MANHSSIWRTGVLALSLLLSSPAFAQNSGQAKQPAKAAKDKKAKEAKQSPEDQAKKAKAAVDAQKKKAVQSLTHLSSVKEQSGDLPGAIETTLELRGLDPESAKHLSRLLALYQKAGMPEKRVEVYHELLKLQPKNPSHTSGLATALYRLDKKGEAVKLWDELLTGDKVPVATYRTVGNAYKAVELYEQALTVYSEGLKQFSTDYNLLYHKGHALEMLGRNDKAIEAYETARLHTKNPRSVDSKLSRMYVVAGLRSTALTAKRKKATEAIEELARLHRELGDKLVALGKRDEAKISYKEALKLTASEDLKKALQDALTALAKVSGKPKP